MKKEVKIEKRPGKAETLDAIISLNLDIMRHQSFPDCMRIVDIEISAIRSAIKKRLIEEIFTRRGKNDTS